MRKIAGSAHMERKAREDAERRERNSSLPPWTMAVCAVTVLAAYNVAVFGWTWSSVGVVSSAGGAWCGLLLQVWSIVRR